MATASLPFSAISTRQPSLERVLEITIWFVLLSSTTRTCDSGYLFRLPLFLSIANSGKDPSSDWSSCVSLVWLASSTGISISNQKVDPLPTSLITPMFPPISSTSNFEMARPRPVPPKERVLELSAWVNWEKILFCWSTGMPIPGSTIS